MEEGASAHFHPFLLALLVLSLQKKDLAPSGSLPLLLKAETGEQVGGLSKLLQFWSTSGLYINEPLFRAGEVSGELHVTVKWQGRLQKEGAWGKREQSGLKLKLPQAWC